MKFTRHKMALEIMSQSDCLSITENDKKVVLHVMGTIVKALKEMGLRTTEMIAMYDILEASTCDDGYFCNTMKRLCDMLYPIVKNLAESEV